MKLQDVLTPIHNALNTDATMISVTHLGGSGRIHKFSSRPPTALLPCITLLARHADRIGEQDFFDELFVTINVFMPSNADYSFDLTRADLINERVEALLDGKAGLSGTSSGVTIKRIRRLAGGPNILPVDPQAQEERVVQSQYQVWIG